MVDSWMSRNLEWKMVSGENIYFNKHPVIAWFPWPPSQDASDHQGYHGF